MPASECLFYFRLIYYHILATVTEKGFGQSILFGSRYKWFYFPNLSGYTYNIKVVLSRFYNLTNYT